MNDHASYTELLYQYEILRTRLAIQQYYLQAADGEAHENIGQVLSLVRVQLSLLQLDLKNGSKEKIELSGKLIGKAVRDLRKMCQLFYAETYILNDLGFYTAIEKEIKTKYPGTRLVIDGAGIIPAFLDNEKKLILYWGLLELLTLATEKQKDRLSLVNIKGSENDITFILEYTGRQIRTDKNDDPVHPMNISIFERIELIGGQFQIENISQNLNRIKLIIRIA